MRKLNARKYILCNIDDNAVQGRLSDNYCMKYFGHKIFAIYSTYLSKGNSGINGYSVSPGTSIAKVEDTVANMASV